MNTSTLLSVHYATGPAALTPVLPTVGTLNLPTNQASLRRCHTIHADWLEALVTNRLYCQHQVAGMGLATEGLNFRAIEAW